MDEHENRCISVLVDEGLSLHTSKYYVGNWFLLLLVLFENDKRNRNILYVSLVCFDRQAIVTKKITSFLFLFSRV